MTTLQLIDGAGEVLALVDSSRLLAAAGIHDVSESDVVELAAFTENAAELRRIADEAQGIVGDELVRRLDMNGRWTLRDGEFEIRAASPEAGTTAYDHEPLVAAVTALVADGVISQTAADAALAPVKPPAEVPWPLLYRAVEALCGELGMAEDAALADELERLLDHEPATTYRQQHAGIKALLKIPGAREAVAACQVTAVPPRRKATVKRKAAG